MTGQVHLIKKHKLTQNNTKTENTNEGYFTNSTASCFK